VELWQGCVGISIDDISFSICMLFPDLSYSNIDRAIIGSAPSGQISIVGPLFHVPLAPAAYTLTDLPSHRSNSSGDESPNI
jgi:hypothetical protein